MTEEDHKIAQDHEMKITNFFVKVFFYLDRVVYKIAYFYLFPYIIVFLSHYLCYEDGCPAEGDTELEDLFR